MKARQYINMMGMAAAVLLSSCVKDTLYDTPHPDYGKIAVTADWSARGEGDRKSTRLNSSHSLRSRMPSSA